MTKALVIKTAGDPDMAGAIMSGMRNHVMYSGDRAIIHGEYERLRDMPYKRRKRRKMTRKERLRKYTPKQHGRAYGAILGAWGLLWYILKGGWR